MKSISGIFIYSFLIISAIFLLGCSNTLVAEFATVNEVNKDSIVIENLREKSQK